MRERLGGARRRHVDFRRVLAVGAGIGRLEIDDVAQEDLAFVQFVAPDDDRLEGERALAEASDHRLAAGFDALGDCDLALARQQFDAAHFAQIHAHRIVGAIGGLGRLGSKRLRLSDLDELAPLDLFLFAFLGVGLFGLLALDDIDAHFVEHRENVLDLFGIDLFGGKDGIQFAIGDEAALLGELDHPLDGGIRHIEERAVGRLDSAGFGFGFVVIFLRHQIPHARIGA